MKPALKNLITDVNGILVGTSEDQELCTGVTIVVGKKPFLAAVDVRGGGPGTRETEMLKLENSIGRADAIVLSGGSAFGLDASSEIQRLLREDKKGYVVSDNIIPLVPSAVIFDLQPSKNYWKNNQSIWKSLAKKAYENLNKDFFLGSIGAGYAATTATLKGGQGSASWKQKFYDGFERAPSRSMLYPLGFKKDDFNKPQVGIASTWSRVTPCNAHIHDLAKKVVDGVENHQGKGVHFNTITVSDGISM